MILKKFIYLVVIFFLAKAISAQDPVPSYIITIGKLPQLAYSTGEDRLGSAKMGYIDTFITMKVIDTVKNLYKVQLSSAHYAFIEKSYAQPVADTILSSAICENWRVKGGEKADSIN